MGSTLLQARLGAPRSARMPDGVLLRAADRVDAAAIAAAYHASYDGEWTAAESLEDIERAFDSGHGALVPLASLVAAAR